jgi:ZIP family zinc transporter
MNEITIILTATWLAGLAAFVGGLVSRFEHFAETETKREIIHGIVALGGGILLAAVAFALVPRAVLLLSPLNVTASFCAGGLAFCALDAWMARRGGAKSQFMAMLMDFLPESISLGAVFGHDKRLGLLLAAFIGAQNLPEGFNAFREILAGRIKPRKALGILFAASLLGPAASAMGYYFLRQHEDLTAWIMIFAGGGIVYLIFQDIAPQSRLQRHWLPPLGAVLGFAVGLLGKTIIG